MNSSDAVEQKKKRNQTIIIVIVSIIVFIALCILGVYLYNKHRDKLVDDAITNAFGPQFGGSATAMP